MSPPVLLLCFSLFDCLLTSSVIWCFSVTFLRVFQIPCFSFFIDRITVVCAFSLLCVPSLFVSSLQPFFSVLSLLFFCCAFVFSRVPFPFCVVWTPYLHVRAARRCMRVAQLPPSSHYQLHLVLLAHLDRIWVSAHRSG